MKKSQKNIVVPKNYQEFEALVARVNESARQLQLVKLEEEQEIEEVISRKAKQKRYWEERIEKDSQSIALYANSNRRELTHNFRIKTVQVLDGKIFWRKNPPSVEIDDEDQAIKELKSHGLNNFIRIEEKVDKESILKNQAAVAFLKYLRVMPGVEQFVIQPANVRFELIQGKRKFKIKIVK